jgi:hypothetical protein
MKMLERLKLAILMLIHDERAGISISDVVMMAVSFLLVAVLGPIAIGEVVGANVTGWNAAVKTIFQVLLPIIWIIGIAIAYVPRGGK